MGIMAENKTVRAEIICPNRHCGKCKRMMDRVQEVNRLFGNSLEIVWIDKPEQWIGYDTWVAPALFINGQTVARGYVPSVKMITDFISSFQGDGYEPMRK